LYVSSNVFPPINGGGGGGYQRADIIEGTRYERNIAPTQLDLNIAWGGGEGKARGRKYVYLRTLCPPLGTALDNKAAFFPLYYSRCPPSIYWGS
jgi:hypothetical protein